MNRLIRIFLIVALLSTQSMHGWAAIGATTIWHVRVGGSNTNGGGYDSAIAGATTDYTDQDAAQLTVTDIVTVGNTTVTSVTGGFTSAMIGNCIRIVGDNYYFITARASSNSITVDRNTGTAVAQTGSVGGAFATLGNFWNGGSIAQPSIATPLAPGHIVYIRGSGSDNPAVDDYTYPATDYSQIPGGDTTSGRIQFIGYNGRPRINYSGLMAYAATYITLKNIYLFLNSSAGYANYGFFNSTGAQVQHTYVENVKVDTNGVTNAVGISASSIINCFITNSGATSASGVGAGIILQGYTAGVYGTTVEKQRSVGIYMAGAISQVFNSLVINNAGNGIYGATDLYGATIIGNTINGNGGDGITMFNTEVAQDTIFNNIISNSGGYGLNNPTAAALAERLRGFIDYNNYYGNSSGARNNLTAGAHDLALDPQFTNAAGGDFSVGTNLANMGFPSLIGGSTTYSYVDTGAAQRQAGGGAAATVGFTFAQ